MGWPQIAWLVWAGMGLGIGLILHGKLHTQKVNLWIKLVFTVFAAWLLWCGGFFSLAHAQVPREALHYRADLTRTARAVWGLDAPVAAFAAQVHQESGWKAGAVSQVGAAGLAQFMPATSRWISGIKPELASNQPFNPGWALRALVTYDKYLYDLTPSRYSPRDRMWVALRGYNGGLGHWQAEATRTGLQTPTRAQVDAACGTARRSPVHCPENLGYPRHVLLQHQPRYAAWGPGV